MEGPIIILPFLSPLPPPLQVIALINQAQLETKDKKLECLHMVCTGVFSLLINSVWVLLKFANAIRGQLAVGSQKMTWPNHYSLTWPANFFVESRNAKAYIHIYRDLYIGTRLASVKGITQEMDRSHLIVIHVLANWIIMVVCMLLLL